jgi:hypothetical protein
MCGARNKVLYQADWSSLENGNPPENMEAGWHIVDDLDVADLVSESAHDFQLSRRHSGFVYMKVLPRQQDPAHDLFDAGRILFDGDYLRFTVKHLRSHRPLRLVLRAAPHAPMRCRVITEARNGTLVSFAAADSWVESLVNIDSDPANDHVQVRIQAEGAECNLFNIWAAQPD